MDLIQGLANSTRIFGIMGPGLSFCFSEMVFQWDSDSGSWKTQSGRKILWEGQFQTLSCCMSIPSIRIRTVPKSRPFSSPVIPQNQNVFSITFSTLLREVRFWILKGKLSCDLGIKAYSGNIKCQAAHNSSSAKVIPNSIYILKNRYFSLVEILLS